MRQSLNGIVLLGGFIEVRLSISASGNQQGFAQRLTKMSNYMKNITLSATELFTLNGFTFPQSSFSSKFFNEY